MKKVNIKNNIGGKMFRILLLVNLLFIAMSADAAWVSVESSADKDNGTHDTSSTGARGKMDASSQFDGVKVKAKVQFSDEICDATASDTKWTKKFEWQPTTPAPSSDDRFNVKVTLKVKFEVSGSVSKVGSFAKARAKTQCFITSSPGTGNNKTIVGNFVGQKQDGQPFQGDVKLNWGDGQSEALFFRFPLGANDDSKWESKEDGISHRYDFEFSNQGALSVSATISLSADCESKLENGGQKAEGMVGTDIRRFQFTKVK